MILIQNEWCQNMVKAMEKCVALPALVTSVSVHNGLEITINRPDESTWKRTQCGSPSASMLTWLLFSQLKPHTSLLRSCISKSHCSSPFSSCFSCHKGFKQPVS